MHHKLADGCSWGRGARLRRPHHHRAQSPTPPQAVVCGIRLVTLPRHTNMEHSNLALLHKLIRDFVIRRDSLLLDLLTHLKATRHALAWHTWIHPLARAQTFIEKCRRPLLFFSDDGVKLRVESGLMERRSTGQRSVRPLSEVQPHSSHRISESARRD